MRNKKLNFGFTNCQHNAACAKVRHGCFKVFFGKIGINL